VGSARRDADRGHGFGAAALGKYLYVASGAKGTGAGEPSNEMLAFSLP